MPPFNPNPSNPQQLTITPLDSKLSGLVLKLKNTSLNEARSTILKSLSDIAYGKENGALDSLLNIPEKDRNPYGNKEDYDMAEKLVEAIITQCPEGLDRIEFEQWLQRNIERLLPAKDEKDSFNEVWQK